MGAMGGLVLGLVLAYCDSFFVLVVRLKGTGLEWIGLDSFAGYLDGGNNRIGEDTMGNRQ